MSLNILYLIDILETNYPRDQNYIIKFMVERGHKVVVITSRSPKFELYDSLFFPRATIHRYPVIGHVRKAVAYFHLSMFKLPFQDFDVVHSFTFFTFSSIYAFLSKESVKVIRSEIGRPEGLDFKKAKSKILPHFYMVNLYKRLYDYITAYNKMETKTLELLGFPKEKIMILSPMIDFYKFSKLGTNLQDRLTIGVIARISPEKGVHKLIPIIRSLLRVSPKFFEKASLVIAGRIDDYRYGYEVLTNLKKPLGKGFMYLGEVAPPYDFYKMVNVVIVPSIRETGAITVLEAMAAGKVVIASDIYPINLYIRHGSNGFLFRSCEEASEIIQYIAENELRVRSIMLKAQEYAKLHDFRSVCRKLELAYYRLLELKSRRS